MTQSELESQIKVALGGTLAEELIYREISSGATNDLEKANRIARSMVKEFGMSRLGRVTIPTRQGRLPARHVARPRANASTASRRPARSTWRCARSSTTPSRRFAAFLQVPPRRPGGRGPTLMEKEVIDGAELKSLIDAHESGPKLVPGSVAVSNRPADQKVEDSDKMASS